MPFRARSKYRQTDPRKSPTLASHRSILFYANWAKGRIDEIDAALASLESISGKMQADTPAKAQQTLAGLREKGDAFRNVIKKHGESSQSSRARCIQSGQSGGCRKPHGSTAAVRDLRSQFVHGVKTFPRELGIIAAEMSVSCCS
jgi:hypothetical protein